MRLAKLYSYIFYMRADFANRSHQLLFGYTQLIGPVPDFAVVVHIDVLLIVDLSGRIVHVFASESER